MEIKILYDREPEIGPSFENLIHEVLKNLGYFRIHRRPKPAGMELDIEATHKKTGKKILCECKAHQDHIGPEDLLYFHGKLRYEIDKGIVDHGMFLSISGFTANAERWYIDAGTKTTNLISLYRSDDMIRLFENADLLASEGQINSIIRNNTSYDIGRRYLAYYKSELYIIQLLLSTETPSYLILKAKGTIPPDEVASRIGKLDGALSKYARLNPVITMKVIINLTDLKSKTSSKISSEINESVENTQVALGDLHAQKLVSKYVDGRTNSFKLKSDITSFAVLAQRFDKHEQKFSFMESQYVETTINKKAFLQFIIRRMKINLSDEMKRVIVRSASIFPSVLSFLLLGDNRYYTNFVIALKDIQSRKEKKNLRNIVISYFFHQVYEAILKDTKLAPPSYLRRRNILGYAFNFRIKLASQSEILLGVGGGSHVYIANKRIGEAIEEGQILSPTDDSARVVLGNHLYTLGLYKDAIETFDVVTKYGSNPDYLHASWNGKSQCYRMLANPKKEIESINKALTYKTTREVLQNKILYFETMGKTDEANEVRRQLSSIPSH